MVPCERSAWSNFAAGGKFVRCLVQIFATFLLPWWRERPQIAIFWLESSVRLKWLDIVLNTSLPFVSTSPICLRNGLKHAELVVTSQTVYSLGVISLYISFSANLHFSVSSCLSSLSSPGSHQLLSYKIIKRNRDFELALVQFRIRRGR